MPAINYQGSGPLILFIGLGVFLSGFFLAYVPKPYLYISVCWEILCVIAALISTRAWAKAFWVNLAAIVLALGSAEVYFDKVYFADEPLHDEVFSDGADLYREHDLLGFAPVKGRTYSHLTLFAGELIYKVTYTIDEHGLRLAPPVAGPTGRDTPCLLFFGDSFTFGEGINDEDTMPYRVGVKSQGHYRVFNFAFLGYGPHQMLAQLQQGLVDDVIHCRPEYAIYLAIPNHVSRAAGLEVWDQHGPKFIVEKGGALVWKGHFDDERRTSPLSLLRRFREVTPQELARYLERSALYKGLLFMHRPVNDKDIDLFLRIVDLSRNIIESRYQGAQFHILFWDFSGKDPIEIKVIDGLRANGINVHLLSTILPDYRAHRDRFAIHPAEGHPNKLAHDILANYILTAIVRPSVHAVPSRVLSGSE